MFRIALLIQMSVYLVLMPLIRSGMAPFYINLWWYSATAIAAFLLGGVLVWRERDAHLVGTDEVNFEPRSSFAPFVVGIAIFYAFVSFTFGLINRRVGSELLADIYANLPFWALIGLRTYEIVFTAVVVITLYFAPRLGKIQTSIIFLAILASLPFMGIVDSRGRLAVIAVSIFLFIPLQKIKDYFFKSFTLNSLYIAAGAAFVGASYFRARQYGRLDDFLYTEVVRRLDGLNLAEELYSRNLLPLRGTWDLGMFSPLVSKIPFIDAARQAKLEGLTSTKQYLLQNVLMSSRFDTASSYITDPAYFAGLAGVAVTFAGLGYIVSRFDRYVATGWQTGGRFRFVITLAFGTSFAMFERDLGSAGTSMIQSILLLSLIFAVFFKPLAKSGARQARRPQAPSFA